eukprot:TRINITY_DN2557_c2_g1_i2.p1 TRINITY_DN2557_c2_g1~~TRINITY_DN2557_c2_g1_i2.p1  ORF type:complete len:401 (-),score=79.76 TRINITY_DN2557_c2_g1_i2:869-2071(-)
MIGLLLALEVVRGTGFSQRLLPAGVQWYRRNGVCQPPSIGAGSSTRPLTMVAESMPVTDLLNQEPFASIKYAFETWDDDDLLALSERHIGTMLEGAQQQSIGYKLYRRIQQLKRPVVIRLHTSAIDASKESDAGTSSPAKLVTVSNAAALADLITNLGAYGLVPKSNTSHVVLTLDELENDEEYWPDFGKRSAQKVFSFEEEAEESKGHRRNLADSWEDKVNEGIIPLFLGEGVRLLKLDLKYTNQPWRQMDGVFLDAAANTIYLVESKSGNFNLKMQLSDKNSIAELDAWIDELHKAKELVRTAADSEQSALVDAEGLQRANKALNEAEQCADLQLHKTAKALRGTPNPNGGTFGDYHIVMVLAAQGMDEDSRAKASYKQDIFRFVSPREDGSGLELLP